jgi:hypothetical protein
LFAAVFGFDFDFFMVGDLGLRGRWGRLAFDGRFTKIAELLAVLIRYKSDATTLGFRGISQAIEWP